jgi:hypothetical protein
MINLLREMIKDIEDIKGDDQQRVNLTCYNRCQ